ncbi:organic solute transporter Ostalpha-domain-containing protein [Lactifluus subvellereus]|nr:organic solute transporter Ostalpha-domain-containing protein [Lactifluus subvellereus]
MSKSATCFPPKAPQKGPPLFQHGNVVFQAHDVGWIVSGIFTTIAIVTSFWLINKHLQWYTNKREQRYIIRLLLMVPIYASISLASYLFWDNATPLLLIRDAYEAILLTAFFYLLLTYLSPDPEVQKAIFRKRGLSREADAELRRRGLPRKKWVFPLGLVRWKPQDGLFFLQLMKWGVLQYCVVRPTTTLVAVILNHIGLYCEQSWSPAWGHIYISTIVSISVTIAMYCLVQLYLCVAKELAPHRPILKLLSVKAVVFLTFWQSTFLSLLTMLRVVKDTPYMTAGEINIGWGAILETFEMSLFAFLHIKAFSYKPYLQTSNARRTPRLRSFAHAMDFRETFRELFAGLVYMWHRIRGAETDPLARRIAVLEAAFDKSRAQVWREHRKEVKGRNLAVEEVAEVEIDGERQWLGLGDDYGYGFSRRERSEALDVQLEKELGKRGYVRPDPELGHLGANPGQSYTHGRRQRSLWRSAYERVSQNNPDREESHALPSSSKRKSRRYRNAEQRVRVYDDQPPPSLLRTYRDHRRTSHVPPSGAQAPQFPGNSTSPDLGLPVQDRYPVVPTQKTVVRADTVLYRLFSNPPLRSDGGYSSRSGDASAVSPSSQSHRTHLALNAAPDVLPQSVDAGRSVEVTAWRPPSPVTATQDAQELQVEPAAHPVPVSRLPVQQQQDGLDQADAGLPLSSPPKGNHMSFPRHESVLYQGTAPAPMVTPTSDPLLDPDREPIQTPSRPEGQSRHTGPSWRELSEPQSPSPAPHRPPRSRAYEAAFSFKEDIPSSRSRAAVRRVEVARPTHTFTPQPSRQPRSKGARRISVPVSSGTSSLPPRRSILPSNYMLSRLPDARSPPSLPRADQNLSRLQHS